MRLLIAVPTKYGAEYLERQKACEETWLKDSPVDFKFFSDAELGLDSNGEQVRPLRTQGMCRYACENGYDFIYRVDADAYVWLDRLLHSGFEQDNYRGFCLDYPSHLARHRTAHGGSGFILSRKAMQAVLETKPFPHPCGSQGLIYWGDIWTGQLLYDHGIQCVQDLRFHNHDGVEDATPDLLPVQHNYISVHPVMPQTMYKFHALRTSSQTS